MDNIRNVIKILFRYRSSTEVLKGIVRYDNVDRDSFITLANFYMPQYSNNEIENMLLFLSSEFEWHNNKIKGQITNKKLRTVNVFDAILLFADTVLVEENGMPLCRYENLLRWRDMIVVLDEDLFITAFLAQQDLLYPKLQRQFFWPPVIGHNNKSLNRLMSQGVAENHFHLKGSAPLFHLSWISMMNDVCNLNFKKTLDGYDDRRLHMKVNYRPKYIDTSLYVSYLQAALIRLYLFACLKGDSFSFRGYVEFAQLKPYLKKESVPDNIADSKMVKLDEYFEYIESFDVYKEMSHEIMRRDVEYLLHDIQELQFRIYDIQKNIELLTEKYSVRTLDYMICSNSLAYNPDKGLNEVISGERWFLYEIFKRIYSEDKKFCRNLNWFYAYLLIKENIRSELVQANNNVGFHNFLLYQDRKETFIENTAFEPVYLQMAVRDTIMNQHIKKLEARITPKDTSEELKSTIYRNDYIILKDEKDSDKLKKRFFYVCHFIKEADKELEKEDMMLFEFVCRHYYKRIQVKKQAYALLEFRRTAGELAERIRGIDASSEEIGCRPEVFAQAFRFLKNQSVEQNDIMNNKIIKLPDMCITYHVGEDFLDVIDGLRAIDEAVSFLNMKCGDRLGHALALGIDVEEWYASKCGCILISQMDYLDNLVWLYSKIRKFRLKDLEDTIHYIEKRYDEYFRIVYLNHMSEEHLSIVMKNAIEYFEERNIVHNYRNKQCIFSINTYYDSWKLRGDDPMYFQEGYFKIDSFTKTEWEEYGINKIFPENYRIRYNPEAAYLYHTYHFNEQVKKEGNQRKEIKVNPCIIKAVKEVQRHMQFIIMQKGIGIETNPSSNALIGTFKRYDKHPILNWYNNGLAMSFKELTEVPQIQVSINTDDQGVFATYIENEYAYLALALEKIKDEDGNPKYSRTLIYQWLDNVRKMGLVQSFEEIDNVEK